MADGNRFEGDAGRERARAIFPAWGAETREDRASTGRRTM